MFCDYECYQIGGPWIAENPACPVHGAEAQRRDREIDLLEDRISQAQTIEDLRELMLELLAMLRHR